MEIVLIEDEELINESLALTLEKEGHKVYPFYNLKDFFSSQINDKKIDLILADITLPDGNFLQELKKHPNLSSTKIMIISGQTEIENIKKAFNLGAEDFIKKPFNEEEVVLRINKIFKTKNIKINDNTFYCPDSKSIIKNNQKIILSKKEVMFLELLIKNKGKILTPEYIMEEVWGEQVPNNTLTVLVKRLREKIGDKDKKIIRSKRDLGYILF